MTEYEKTMLKLKILELTQRQALLAVTANTGIQGGAISNVQIVQEAEEVLDKAIVSVGKLL